MPHRPVAVKTRVGAQKLVKVRELFAKRHHVEQQLSVRFSLEHIDNVLASTAEYFCEVVRVVAQFLSFDAAPFDDRTLAFLVVLESVRSHAPLSCIAATQQQRRFFTPPLGT
jgi:hypothetical protein